MQNCNMVIMRRIPDLCLMAKINGELVLRMWNVELSWGIAWGKMWWWGWAMPSPWAT
jgi:hypothetical protein